jgi:hypothetical protein
MPSAPSRDASIAAAGAFVFWQHQETKEAKKSAASNATLIALGMRGYSQYEGNGRMIPRAIYDKDGKSLLSWRVLLLPYLEQVSLFKQFKLDEPWDSPHNIQLLDKMPSLPYASPRENNKPGETYYQVFTGPGTVFPDPRKERLPLFADCADRLLIVEAANSVPWTKPEDLPYDPQGPLPPLGGVFGEGRFFGGFGNKPAQWFDQPTEALLRAAITGQR